MVQRRYPGIARRGLFLSFLLARHWRSQVWRLVAEGGRVGRDLGLDRERDRFGTGTMRTEEKARVGGKGEGRRQRTGWEVRSGGRKSRHGRGPCCGKSGAAGVSRVTGEVPVVGG